MANGIIDVHAHVVFDALLGKAGRYGPEVGRDEHDTPYFRVGDYAMKPLSYDGTVFTDLSLRLRELDRLQIDLQVLSPNPLTFLHGIEAPIAADFCRQHNTLMAAVVAEAPDRLVGLAALPMQDVPAACDALEHAVGELGLKGAMIGTDFRQGFSCRSLDPLYQKFVDLDVPLFVHASSTNGVDNLQDPLAFVQTTFPPVLSLLVPDAEPVDQPVQLALASLRAKCGGTVPSVQTLAKFGLADLVTDEWPQQLPVRCPS